MAHNAELLLRRSCFYNRFNSPKFQTRHFAPGWTKCPPFRVLSFRRFAISFPFDGAAAAHLHQHQAVRTRVGLVKQIGRKHMPSGEHACSTDPSGTPQADYGPHQAARRPYGQHRTGILVAFRCALSNLCTMTAVSLTWTVTTFRTHRIRD